MVVRGKHCTEMKDELIMHLIAKTHTYGRRGLASVMATAGNWTAFHSAINDVVCPCIVNQ